MNNLRFKDKHPLLDLVKYGTRARKLMRPEVLIGDHDPNCAMFKDGDILDANAVLNLILNYAGCCGNSGQGSEEIENIKDQLSTIDAKIIDGDRSVQDAVDELKQRHILEIAELRNDITNIELTPGPQGEKGDPFTFYDFTPEQIETLRGPRGANGEDGKKGDKGDKGLDGDAGVGIKSIVQTASSIRNGGENRFRITLDDDRVFDFSIYNGDAALVDSYTKFESDEQMQLVTGRVSDIETTVSALAESVLNVDPYKHLFVSAAQYSNIQDPDQNTIYFVYEDDQQVTPSQWGFGDSFPVTFTDNSASTSFGDPLPITLS